MIRLTLAGLLALGTQASAADWQILPAQSMVGFHTRVTYPVNGPAQLLNGMLPVVEGHVTFDPEVPEQATLDVVLDTTGITVDDLGLDQELRRADWLGVRRFALARLQAKGFEQTSADKFTTQATLTLRGTSQVLPVVFGLVYENGQAIATGTAEIDRYAFEIGARVPETVTPRFVPIWFTVVADEVAP